MASGNAKGDRPWPNHPGYDTPNPRPLKPPWPTQLSTLANNSELKPLYSLHLSALASNNDFKHFQLTWIFVSKMAFDWNDDIAIAPPWEILGLFARDNSQQLAPEPGIYQSGAFTPVEFLLTGPTGPRFNSSSTTPNTTKPASTRKRHMPAQIVDSETAHKRQKLCQASTIANGIFTSPPNDSSKENNLSLLLDSSGDSINENCETLFPCPFYLHDPKKYSTKAYQACTGLGWKINRLKEHIIRRHYSASQTCCRCFTSFKDAAELYRHLQLTNPCEKHKPVQSDFECIDELQKSQIRNKMRGKSDLHKWKEIYRIVFRLDSSAIVPSPYKRSWLSGAADASLADFGAFLNDKADSSANEQEKSEIQACLRLLGSFKQSRDAASIASVSHMSCLMSDSPDGADTASEGNEYLFDDFEAVSRAIVPGLPNDNCGEWPF